MTDKTSGKFLYESSLDYWGLQEYRLECAMEKKPGIIVFDTKEYHVNERGRYTETPPFELQMNKIQGGIARA